jgi:hypothetical protein
VNRDVDPTTILAIRSIVGSTVSSKRAATSKIKMEAHTHMLRSMNKLIALKVVSALVSKSITFVRLIAKKTYDV